MNLGIGLTPESACMHIMDETKTGQNISINLN